MYYIIPQKKKQIKKEKKPKQLGNQKQNEKLKQS